MPPDGRSDTVARSVFVEETLSGAFLGFAGFLVRSPKKPSRRTVLVSEHLRGYHLYTNGTVEGKEG